MILNSYHFILPSYKAHARVRVVRILLDPLGWGEAHSGENW